MTISEKVRRAYERRPYPFGNSQALTGRSWELDLNWVGAIGRVGSGGFPGRVLVAGCGDGTEAFNLQRRLPGSDIVAVDFSARSIAIARQLQRREGKMSRIRFIEADLSDRRLPGRLGRFDLITCQGVLSYFTRPAPVLKNLGRCLSSEGVLYVGVNGLTHVSTRLRPALKAFGYNLEDYAENPRLRDILRLCDEVLAANGYPPMSGFGAGYLASDVFGAVNQCLSLEEWIAHARVGGLHFRGNQASAPAFRRFAEKDFYPLLMPWSRAKVCELIDRLSPAPFHRLLFSRKREPNPPWEDRDKLLRRRVVLTGLHHLRLPPTGKRVRDRLRTFKTTSASTGVSAEWRMPEWELELLRSAGGADSLARLLRRCPLSVPFAELRRQLYLLYQLGIIDLMPLGG